MNSAVNRMRLALLCELAARDLWHDRKVSLCIIAALVAVIAPLLLLFGLKYGVVSRLQQDLLSDPHNLEIRLVGNYSLDAAWFERLNARPEVAFALPLTRSLNTQADLQRGPSHFVSDAEVLPTAPGDPLLRGQAAPEAGSGQVLLSAAAARQLDVRPGDRLHLRVLRRLQGQTENGDLPVRVSGILDEAVFTRPAVLVPLAQLVALEDFRDGFQVPALGFRTGQPRPEARTHYARARLYARQLDDVAPLAAWLEQQHLETRTRASEIAAVQAINQLLGLVFAVIAWTAIAGCVASLAGAFLANIDRKRRDLALLRLLGFRRSAAGLYVLLQATLLTSLAFMLGYAAWLGGSAVFNHALGSQLADRQFVCQLEPVHLLLAFASALLIALLVAGIGGLRAIQIQPAESLRAL